MLSKGTRIWIALLCLIAITIPTPARAKSAADDNPLSTPTPSADPFVSIEVSPTSLPVGETASISVKLNNVPVEGYKSAEFTCS